MLHLRSATSLLICTFLALASLIATSGTARAQGGMLAVWDTGRPSAEPLSPATIIDKTGWKTVATDAAPAFKGDAVLSNGRLLAVARIQGTGIELYSLGSGQPIFRSRLLLGPASPIERLTLTENSRSTLGLEVTSKSGAAIFRLKRGELFIEAESLAGKAPLRVECASRFAVLPDFFADDILFDPRKVPVDKVDLPSENFLLHFTGKQDVIVMNVFENREQDVRVTLAGKGDERAITGSEIDFGKKGSKIWVAVLEGNGIWHTFHVIPGDAGTIFPLDWRMPFTAQWRVDFTRQDGLTDSWDMLLPEKEGDGYIKPSWLTKEGKISAPNKTKSGEIDYDAYREGWIGSTRLNADRDRWTTVLGWVSYPCWSDRTGRGYLQPLKNEKLSFNGPVLIYPITRLADTPLTQYTPVDIMRNTLGVGPCQHLLDIEGQQQVHVGRATCHVWRYLCDTYKSGKQKEKRKEIEVYVNDALDFVRHIGNRIDLYVAFGKDMRKYLQEQQKAHPELKEQLAALETLAREIDERVAPRKQKILEEPVLKKIAAKVAQRKEAVTATAIAAQLNRDFLASDLLDYNGADWEAKLDKAYTEPLTTIGGEQDEMVGECRWVVKALRQKAGILLATDPRMAPIAAEIRARTQKMLRSGAAYEGARH